MNERQMQFRVGVIVFATMIIGGLLVALSGPSWVGWLPWGRNSYLVGIKVDRAPGVAKSTPVRKNGILIGRVKSIDEQSDGIVVWAEVNGKSPLYKEYEPHVRTNVLTDATVEFDFDYKHKKLAADAQPVSDGFVFENGVADGDPLESLAKLGELKDQFGKASLALEDAGKQVGELAANLNKVFGDKNQSGRVGDLVETTNRAMGQFEQTMRAVNEIIGDPQPEAVQQGIGQPPTNRPSGIQPQGVQPSPVLPPGVQPPGVQPPTDGQQLRRRLRQGINDFPEAIQQFKITMDKFQEVLKSANKNLKNLEGFTEPLGQKGSDVANALIKAVTGLDQLIVDLNSVTQAINSRQGTIGRLLYDDGTAYNDVKQLMKNINVVLNDIHNLTYRLQPVVNDARIFMDKIATEPGRIISGAVRPSNLK
jgi:phospholipid/cholesterol/gamma-HCH transport system substrate-binding protein